MSRWDFGWGKRNCGAPEWITGTSWMCYINWADFLEKNPGAQLYFATTKARQVYTQAAYGPDCYLVFGKESAGIPEEILVERPDRCVRIPMVGRTRSLNLSNSAAILLYEALRQNGFADRVDSDHRNNCVNLAKITIFRYLPLRNRVFS